ncbi:MAG: hypothetical protein QN189_00885 [Armatimonadota bacterium]|nr:hypothetical protein [Armatimonadota bacterium]MDR7433665.1 hypothetical protein [Armatimonadota bacterium]
MKQSGVLRPIVVGRPASTLRDLALLAQSGKAIAAPMQGFSRRGKILVALATVSFGAASGLAVASIMGSLWAAPLSLLSLCLTALALSRGFNELLAFPSPRSPLLEEEIALEEEVCAFISSRIEEGLVVLNEVPIPIPGSIQRCSHLLVGSAGIVLLLAFPARGQCTLRKMHWQGMTRISPPYDRVAFEMRKTLGILMKGWGERVYLARPELADLLVHAAVVVPDDSTVQGPTLVPVLRVSEIPRWYETLPPIGGWALGWRFKEVATALTYELRRLVILRPPIASLPKN